MFDLGTYDDDLSFEYNSNTAASIGCGALLNGEMWYFGGQGNGARQVWTHNLKNI